ncbi:MAG: hypothetical protein LBT21_05875 [Oscillospiraceae bacterium]|jgi:hypothetical protein|nr:hypothetical protein [Oscillospiraceae bacterium]
MISFKQLQQKALRLSGVLLVVYLKLAPRAALQYNTPASSKRIAANAGNPE